mgnify:FL=1
MNIEVCCNSVFSVQIAEKLGASRVELCQNLLQDGLTPSLELLQEVCESHAIPIHVLIRPREGDFFYSTSDLKRIDEAIHQAHKFSIAGIVVGHMNREKGVDPALLRQWRTLTQGLELTFHRAFDQVAEPFNVLEHLIEAGFNRILSSGQQPTAALGIDLLQDLQKVAGTSLEVMPGGGINDKNAPLFLDAGFKSIHLSAKSATHPAHLEPIIDPYILKNVITQSSK